MSLALFGGNPKGVASADIGFFDGVAFGIGFFAVDVEDLVVIEVGVESGL